MIRPAIAFAACLLLLPAPRAAAETTQCTAINSLPAVINAQGVYCLKKDLSTAISSGAAITIGSNNVTLDCNDWKIGGLAAGLATNATGIEAIDRKNITIRNCGIRGFRNGIFLYGNGAYHLVEDNRIDLSTSAGIQVEGDGTTVRGNRVYDTGGQAGYANGIYVMGDAITIVDNTVAGVHSPTHGATGMSASPVAGAAFVAHNRITGVDGSLDSRGLYLQGRSLALDNMVARTPGPAPAASHIGVYCTSANATVRGSLIAGFAAPATPISALCTASGNTVN